MVRKIEVLGLGSGDIDQLPLGIYRKLKGAKQKVYIRTSDHPVVKTLEDEGVQFESFDTYYEDETDFLAVYKRIVDTLILEAQTKTLTYAVPGHPMLAEKTVQLLLNQDNIEIDLIGGQSYLDALFSALKIDPIDGFQFVDGTSFKRSELNYGQHLLFCQVYDQFIASDVKLSLLEDLPAHYKVVIIEAAGTGREKIVKIPLEELDRVFEMSNLTTVYVPPVKQSLLHHTFPVLRDVIAQLRGPNGCPWDKEQTHESLRKYAIEEVYELVDAIDQEDYESMIDELGDVLLQVMLHSQIGEDDGYFSIDDVIEAITNKMIHRHPHVFADNQTVHTSKDVMKTWDELKREEKGNHSESILDRVQKHSPALQKASQLQKEAAKVGFNWEKVQDVWRKFDEELEELHDAILSGDQKEIENELGDLFFVLTNIAQFYNVNPELALNRTNNKFISRFSYVEHQLQQNGEKVEEVTLEKMDMYWNEAKRKE